MLKATLTIEGSLEEIERAASLLIAGGKIAAMHAVEEPLNEAEQRLMTRVPPPPADEPSEAEEAAVQAQEQVLAPGRKRKRKKSKLVRQLEESAAQAAAEAETPETPEAAAPAPETPEAQTTSQTKPNGKTGSLPDLETLKGLVVNAVKSARAGGDSAILNFLPAFKKETKLPFVMEAKDEHRVALLDLLTKAGIAVG